MQILLRTHTKGDEVPHIDKSIRRQPHNAIGFARIIPVLKLVVHGVNRYDELRRVAPPSEGAILDDVIQLESLHPLLLFGPTQGTPNYSDVAERLTGTWRVHPISVHEEGGINRYSHPIRRRNDPQLNRVQFNVATLNEEEEEEGTRENREQWESDVHDGYSIRI